MLCLFAWGRRKEGLQHRYSSCCRILIFMQSIKIEMVGYIRGKIVSSVRVELSQE